MPELDLPILPESFRRPPVLTMDQYLLWNTRDEFESPLQSDPAERCDVPFVL